MPLMSGYEATRILKDRIDKHELPEIYIAACTADVTQKNKDKCKKCGFDECIEKPISKEVLGTLLEKVFNDT